MGKRILHGVSSVEVRNDAQRAVDSPGAILLLWLGVMFKPISIPILNLLALAAALLAGGAVGLAGAEVQAAEATNETRRTVVVLGDSIAAGYGLDPSEAFPAGLQKKIDETGLAFTVVNAGLSGDTTAGGLRRIDWLLKRKVDVLILELGGNDGLRGIPVEVTRTNLQGIIDRTKAKYPGVEIIVAGMQMPPNMGPQYGDAFQKVFPEIAKRNKAALIPFVLEGVGGNPELNLPDRIHPTAKGHRIITENVWTVLKPVLERMAPARR